MDTTMAILSFFPRGIFARTRFGISAVSILYYCGGFPVIVFVRNQTCSGGEQPIVC